MAREDLSTFQQELIAQEFGRRRQEDGPLSKDEETKASEDIIAAFETRVAVLPDFREGVANVYLEPRSRGYPSYPSVPLQRAEGEYRVSYQHTQEKEWDIIKKTSEVVKDKKELTIQYPNRRTLVVVLDGGYRNKFNLGSIVFVHTPSDPLFPTTEGTRRAANEGQRVIGVLAPIR
jgi:hypothetical protein